MPWPLEEADIVLGCMPNPCVAMAAAITTATITAATMTDTLDEPR